MSQDEDEISTLRRRVREMEGELDLHKAAKDQVLASGENGSLLTQ